MLTFGVAALARPTFDVPFAEETKNRAFAALRAAGIRTVGTRELLFDRDAAERAIANITASGPIDLLLILQVTFTDATMTVKLAKEAKTPLTIWALPEPRIGGRLRLNAYCGLNLAAHALGRAGVAHGSLYADPSAPGLAESLRALSRSHALPKSTASAANLATRVRADAERAADRVLGALADSRITVVGKHPDGFDTCEFDPDLLARLANIKVDHVMLGNLFIALDRPMPIVWQRLKIEPRRRSRGWGKSTPSNSTDHSVSSVRSKMCSEIRAHAVLRCGVGPRCSPSMVVPRVDRWP